ncbi:MAG: hypothetical protein AAFZ07_28450 [Actinomycetota bacterium]
MKAADLVPGDEYLHRPGQSRKAGRRVLYIGPAGSWLARIQHLDTANRTCVPYASLQPITDGDGGCTVALHRIAFIVDDRGDGHVRIPDHHGGGVVVTLPDGRTRARLEPADEPADGWTFGGWI